MQKTEEVEQKWRNLNKDNESALKGFIQEYEHPTTARSRDLVEQTKDLLAELQKTEEVEQKWRNLNKDNESALKGFIQEYEHPTTIRSRDLVEQAKDLLAESQKTENAAPKRIRVGGNVAKARLLRQVRPQYPPLARQARIQGTVKLSAIIAKDGTIQKLEMTNGHPLLVPAALAAVKQWRYKPTLLNSEAVEVLTSIDVHFTLSD